MDKYYIYISYFVLIWGVLKFYKNDSKYSELISTILISIGIYIINLLMPQKTKENFSQNLENGSPCTTNSSCITTHCINNKCSPTLKKNEQCTNNDECNNCNNRATSGTCLKWDDHNICQNNKCKLK